MEGGSLLQLLDLGITAFVVGCLLYSNHKFQATISERLGTIIGMLNEQEHDLQRLLRGNPEGLGAGEDEG